ncbi:MAG: hypothetical protein J0L70_31040 [Leptolyngbya sp. UWPOB_LEPTO1]|uniref:hypothetical protein n=1 Tax=Leptolyngbya sp. UWPOB_LEPTO1 TaxID=2815653 RepID=UPI001AC3DAA5|nr:hypothetical protein [Leptolyngbya sp. UWPOB_LEPTO1]MBN8564952.1 hypothetical protein [Leptolyngbya sp. UWPOB_LEPTO1]
MTRKYYGLKRRFYRIEKVRGESPSVLVPQSGDRWNAQSLTGQESLFLKRSDLWLNALHRDILILYVEFSAAP